MTPPAHRPYWQLPDSSVALEAEPVALTCVSEVEAYDHTGRLLRFPEPGCWLRLDCPSCGLTSENPAVGHGAECECGTFVRVAL